MKITAVMVATYITDCCIIGTKPCKYFQLNSPFFDENKGVFSKIDMDKMIPERWRLSQKYDDGVSTPSTYPVFFKPEWGENASGIHRADSANDLKHIRQQIASSRVPYIIQQGATFTREFEIFTLQDFRDKSKNIVFTVTEAENQKEQNPINSINNPDTRYRNRTDEMTDEQINTFSSSLREIGHFSISRLSVRSNSIEDLVAGDFQVIELNLFTPMPIHMLDSKYSLMELWKMVRRYMMYLARLTKVRDKSLKEKPVYTKVMFYNRENALANFIRDRV